MLEELSPEAIHIIAPIYGWILRTDPFVVRDHLRSGHYFPRMAIILLSGLSVLYPGMVLVVFANVMFY